MAGPILGRGQGVIIGLGTGRCGTSSLAALLNGQPETTCFHELNPSSMAWTGAEATVGSLMRDFSDILQGGDRVVTADMVSPNRLAPLSRLASLERVSAIGDVGSYYLPYVETMLARWPEIRFPCLQRDRSAVIESFVVKLCSDGPVPRNHWVKPGEGKWRADRIWDRMFPKIEVPAAAPLESYVAAYYDLYCEGAESIARKYPQNVRIFQTDDLNTPEGRARILNFCLPGRVHVDFPIHTNAGS
jgi:hypothetical protein